MLHILPNRIGSPHVLLRLMHGFELFVCSMAQILVRLTHITVFYVRVGKPSLPPVYSIRYLSYFRVEACLRNVGGFLRDG